VAVPHLDFALLQEVHFRHVLIIFVELLAQDHLLVVSEDGLEQCQELHYKLVVQVRRVVLRAVQQVQLLIVGQLDPSPEVYEAFSRQIELLLAQVQQSRELSHEFFEEVSDVDLGLDTTRQLVQKVCIGIRGDSQIAIMPPSVLEVGVELLDELLVDVALIVLLKSAQEHTEVDVIFVRQSEVPELFDHVAEAVHGHRSDHDSEEHHERTHHSL